MWTVFREFHFLLFHKRAVSSIVYKGCVKCIKRLLDVDYLLMMSSCENIVCINFVFIRAVLFRILRIIEVNKKEGSDLNVCRKLQAVVITG